MHRLSPIQEKKTDILAPDIADRHVYFVFLHRGVYV